VYGQGTSGAFFRYQMRYGTFAFDYAEFKTFLYDPLAAQHGLGHGCTAPAVLAVTAVSVVSRPVPASRDPVRVPGRRQGRATVTESASSRLYCCPCRAA